MKPVRRFLRRVLSFSTQRQDEERMASEIDEHLAMLIDEYIRGGVAPEEARRQAVLKFGGIVGVKETYRDGKGLPIVETTLSDIQQALRRLWKSPTFTGAAVLTLALGIGATTSIFTLVHAVLLKSLAVSNPQDLYRVGRANHCCTWGGYSQDKEFSIFSYDLYEHLRDHTGDFEELAGFQAGETLLCVRREGSQQAAQSYPGEFVSGNYFSMFGVRAYAGRSLSVRDDRPDAPPVAVMSYRLWSRAYGSNPRTIGSVFDLNGKAFTIIGIAPPEFFGDTLRSGPPDFFLPLATEPQVQGDSSMLRDPGTHWLHLIGRMKPGAKPSSVESHMRLELRQWLRSHWGEMDANARTNLPQQTLYLGPGGAGITSMREQFERWLQILLLASGFVLAIVCANIANLMLVRGMERRGQTALQIALGARPLRIVRQALAESVVLSLIGGAAGIAVAFAATHIILRIAFHGPAAEDVVPIDGSPSGTVLAFAFGVALLTGIGFGIAPAWMAARTDPIEALRGASRSTNRSASLPRKFLVALQAALSLTLLSASGLLTAALTHLETQNFGFEQQGRTIVNIDPQLAGYHVEQLPSLYRRIRMSLSLIPGVSSVAIGSYSPLSDDSWNDIVIIDGHHPPGPKDTSVSALVRVSGSYLEAIGNRVVRGRGISDIDTDRARHVAVVNEAFARNFFKGEDPMGKHFGREIGASRQYEIVGVAKDARYLHYNLDKPISPLFYSSAEQMDAFSTKERTRGDLRSHFPHDIVVVAKPGAILSEGKLRQALAFVDPNMPVNFIRTLQEQLSGQFRQQRLLARLTSFFGLLSLILASIGLNGLTAYNAGRRTSEIGIRMALGASRRNVIALVLRGALGLLALGLLAGLGLTAATGNLLRNSRKTVAVSSAPPQEQASSFLDRWRAAAPFALLSNQLYGINPYDARVMLFAALSLGLSAFVASLIPAWRASLASPLQALRTE